MGARERSDALHDRVRALVSAFERGVPIPESFDSLAADIARFQADCVPGYARLCAAHGTDARGIAHAAQAPAVPTEAFKFARIFAFEETEAAVTFRTSGTTIGSRGAHSIRDLRTYDAAALAFGRVMLCCAATPTAIVLVLGPSSARAPDSSLAHMCSLFVQALGSGDARGSDFVRGDALDLDAFRRRVSALSAETPAIVLGASFAFVHLLDRLRDELLPLPARSCVMQTGGFKGRAREVPAAELRAAIARAFAIPERAVVSEYGMTELSSQFWEATLADPSAPQGVFVEPPWARVVPVDPETLAPVAEGATGIARIEDLANVDSSFAILTQDRVRRVAGGFELLGRAPGASTRGCSIALDEILSAKERCDEA
jgi:Acyl-protein synthetase, LuxE